MILYMLYCLGEIIGRITREYIKTKQNKIYLTEHRKKIKLRQIDKMIKTKAFKGYYKDYKIK